MIPKELLKKVRQIQIKSDRMVNDVLAGQYKSVFKGRGIEFDEVREYQAGDDVRTIDWKVTARMGRPFIKKFVEERELTIMLVVDASSSGRFGTKEKLKKELIAEICAVLAFSAIKNNDKVGLIIFTDTVEKYVPPKKGKSHVLRVIREALFYKPKGRGTGLSGAIEFLGTVIKRKTVTFVLSDFLGDGYERSLQIANKRHDIIAITVTDPRETEMNDSGLLELEDAETGEAIVVDTSDPSMRSEFIKLTRTAASEREHFFKSSDIDSINIRADLPYIDPIIKFFSIREKRR